MCSTALKKNGTGTMFFLKNPSILHSCTLFKRENYKNSKLNLVPTCQKPLSSDSYLPDHS